MLATVAGRRGTKFHPLCTRAKFDMYSPDGRRWKVYLHRGNWANSLPGAHAIYLPHNYDMRLLLNEGWRFAL